ncbi:MAG: hypothetical protein QM564_13280 [Bergeyella sp.]
MRKLAVTLILKHSNFFTGVAEQGAERKFYYFLDGHNFYDLKLLSCTHKFNIQNHGESTLEFYKENNHKLRDVRIDEEYRLFISKDKEYKTNKFIVESKDFLPFFTSFEHLLSGTYKRYTEITEHQFERLKKIAKNLIFDNTDLDISAIIPKQDYSVTILD